MYQPNYNIKRWVGPVELEPIEHVYIHKTTGRRYKSVTTVLGMVEPHFDSEGVSEAIVRQSDEKKNPIYLGMNKEQILDYWQELNDRANEYGSHVHDTIEYYLLSNKTWVPDDELQRKVIAGYESLGLNEGQMMWPERIMFAESYNLAGMSDLIIDLDNDHFQVVDWKGLDVSTPVLTNNGWKTMGTVQVGDKVYDVEGKLVNVLHTSDIKYENCYEITFDNKETVIADEGHRWLISFYGTSKTKDVVMTTIELFDYMNDLNTKTKKQSDKLPKVKIAAPLNRDIPPTNLPIDPYVLGVWLGDGHSADGKITNMHDDVWRQIERRGYKIGKDVSQNGAGKAKTCTVFGLMTELRKLNLLMNKHVPEIYLHSSYEQRLDILRGLMDSDGYYNAKRKRFVMSTTKSWQVEATVQLTASLGFKPTVLSFIKKFNGKGIKVYDICFNTESINPFLVRNQDNITYTVKETRKYKNIKSIKKVDTVPTRCIEVDSPTKTFLYGHTLSVTHNTNKEFNYVNKYRYETLHKPFDHLQNCQYSIYTLQLSVYAYMYELEFPNKKCVSITIGYWDKEKETMVKIPITYLKTEAKKLLELYKYKTML